LTNHTVLSTQIFSLSCCKWWSWGTRNQRLHCLSFVRSHRIQC